jgi:hypothetical protein
MVTAILAMFRAHSAQGTFLFLLSRDRWLWRVRRSTTRYIVAAVV